MHPGHINRPQIRRRHRGSTSFKKRVARRTIVVVTVTVGSLLCIILLKLGRLSIGREPLLSSSSSHILHTVPCEHKITKLTPSNNASMETPWSDFAKRRLANCDTLRRRKEDAPSLSHPPPPRKMSDTLNPVYFLHVGKAGGTSVDDLLLNILQCERKMYVGDLHYDYSYIQQRELPRIKRRMGLQHQQLDDDDDRRNNVDDDDHDDYDDDVFIRTNVDVITFLRHPVSRAVSQFYFSKKLKWAKKTNATFLHQTFDEYIDDPNKDWFQPIADGESGTDFLAGIFPTEKGHWVASDERETRRKVYLRKNKTAACLLAAKRLEDTTWFGLMEDIDRSMVLLQLTLGLPTIPVLPRANSGNNNGRNPQPSRETLKKVEKYIPKDLWLYEYAQRLFEARWNYFMGDNNCTYVSPELPQLSDFIPDQSMIKKIDHDPTP